MKKTLDTVLTICMFLLLMGCRKKDGPGSQEPVIIPHDSQQMEVQLPNQSRNFNGYTLFSLSDAASLDASGRATVSYNKGVTNVAWLFDNNNNLILAGFVNDTIKMINAASTANVLLYYGFAIPFQPRSLIDAYINEIEQVEGVKAWVAAFSDLLKRDPSAVHKGTYKDALQLALGKLTRAGSSGSMQYGQDNQVFQRLMMAGSQNRQAATIKNADIVIDEAGVKSGLQVSSPSLSNVQIVNTYRRRAHAFFYKESYVATNGTYNQLIKTFTAGTVAGKREAINPVVAANSFTGIVGSWMEKTIGNMPDDKVLDFAQVTAGPFRFSLEDNEKEAIYKVRVVGPGQSANTGMLTEAESSKLFELQIETIGLDMLLPIIASAISSKTDFNPGSNATDEFYCCNSICYSRSKLSSPLIDW